MSKADRRARKKTNRDLGRARDGKLDVVCEGCGQQQPLATATPPGRPGIGRQLGEPRFDFDCDYVAFCPCTDRQTVASFVCRYA